MYLVEVVLRLRHDDRTTRQLRNSFADVRSSGRERRTIGLIEDELLKNLLKNLLLSRGSEW